LSLYEPGIEALLRIVALLERGDEVKCTPQHATQGQYYTFPTDDELARFTGLGWRLFDPEDLSGLLLDFGVPQGLLWSS
jgi:methionyl-tRNA formyltransferase